MSRANKLRRDLFLTLSEHKEDNEQIKKQMALEHVNTKSKMLQGSLVHRKSYLESMHISWSLPNLFEKASKFIPSEVFYFYNLFFILILYFIISFRNKHI